MMKFPIKSLLLATLVSLLAGCGAKSNVPPPTPLKPLPADTGVSVQVVRRVHIGEGVSNRMLQISPAIGQGEVILANESGEVDALVWGSFMPMWRIFLKGQISSTPLLAGDTVYLGTQGGTLYALNRRTGAVVWTAQLPSSLYATPALEGNTLVVHVHNGAVMAFSAASGQSLWSYQPMQPNVLLRGDSAPAIVNNQVLVGLHSGVLVSLSLSTGHEMWSTPIALPMGASSVSRMVDIVAKPCVDHDRSVVFVATYQGQLAAVTLDSGRVLWSVPISVAEDMAFHDETLYVTTVSGDVEGIDTDTGRVRFIQKGLAYRDVTSPVWDAGWIVVSDSQGYVHFLNDKTGAFVSRLQPFSGAGTGSGVVFLGDVYYRSARGQLVVLKPREIQ